MHVTKILTHAVIRLTGMYSKDSTRCCALFDVGEGGDWVASSNQG